MDYIAQIKLPAESPLSRRKQQIVALSMAAFHKRIDQLFDNGTLSVPVRRPAKRAREASVDEETHERGITSKQKRSKSEPVRLFACPFHKHDPAKFKDVKTCCGPGFSDPHRVKEHIYRRHAVKNSCNRCCEIFRSPEGLKEHQRAETSCKLRKQPRTDLINEEQEAQLRARAKSGSSPEDKWKEIYRILFPDAKVPSPFYNEAEEQEGIAQAEQQSRFKDLDECRVYVKRELSRLVEPILVAEVERAWQTVQASVLKKANALIIDVGTRLMRTLHYQAEQSASFEPAPDDSTAMTPDESLEMPFNQFLEELHEEPLVPYLMPGGFDLEAFMLHHPNLELDIPASVAADSAYYSSSDLNGARWDATSFSS